MKNAIKLFRIIALVAVIGFAVACGGGDKDKSDSGALIGTYEGGPLGLSLTFAADNKVTFALGDDYKVEGTYEIKDGKLAITTADGETKEFEYALEGDKLTVDGDTITKKVE
jgi:hypothetical protein